MIKNNSVLVQSILNAMQEVIQKHGLELLQRYPNDLLVHDKAMLEQIAVPGAKIAWMVGHSHTHLTTLGLHPKENEKVEYLTHLANDDRFFLITVKQNDRFDLSEIDRKAFASLSKIPVPYTVPGYGKDFWLKCNNTSFWLHRGTRIGHVALIYTGSQGKPTVEATITPILGIPEIDRAALEQWCAQACIEMTQSLFVRSEVTWADAIQAENAA